MKLSTGNIWEMEANRRVITTSRETYGWRGEERAIMTSGIAKQALDKFPGIDEVIGCLFSMRTCGPHVWPIPFDLIVFPVKEKDKDNGSLHIIQESAYELVELTDKRGWKSVLLPRPGTGRGGLEWKAVREVLEEVLDDRFTCVTYEKEQSANNTD